MAKTAKHLEVQVRRIYRPESEVCRHCGQPLHDRGYYQWRKIVQQLDGPRYVASLATVCVNPACDQQAAIYTSAAAQMVTVPECTYGLDVIAQIGWWRDREHLNRAQIHARLTAQGVQLCERQVDHLYARYQVLVGCAERLERQQLDAIVKDRGGLIIGLDRLEPEGASEQLWVVREVQTARTLVVGWLPRVNHETLAALLQPVVDLGLPVLATVSDKQGCVRKALQLVWPAAPHQWCQSHYLGHAMRPIYDQDAALKTELRKTLRAELSESLGAVLTDVAASVFAPQLVTGLAVLAAPAAAAPEQPPTTLQVVRDLALDLQQAFARQGRAPFVLSGQPLFEDLQALRQTVGHCLTLREDLHLRQWYTVLDTTLPRYQVAFAEITQACAWVNGIQRILDRPLPTAAEPGPGGAAVARALAHYLGPLATLADLSPWLQQFRQDLYDLSERYWSGLFHCYDVLGLPATNNAHESLYGQTKRQLRRQLGVCELREPLLRRGAWAVLQYEVATPGALRERLAQVSWRDNATERMRYEGRQAQFRRRYRWRHHRAAVLQQRLADWAVAVPDC